MTAFLELRDLSLTLGGFRLGPLSLALSPGEYLVLLGPSGCGKTTLLNAISGVHGAGAGMLLLAGEESGLKPVHRRRIGYVSQIPNLFPHLTVEDNVRFGLAYVRAPEDELEGRFRRIVALVGADGFLGRYPATLSGGERRRVALARSIVTGPRVLLLDEPLGMLDPNARAGMFEVLRTIHEETGAAVIHVTHDREEAWIMGGACAVMREGKIERS